MKSEKTGKRLRLNSVNTVMFCYFCLLSVLLIVLVYGVFYIIVSATLENQAKSRIVSVGGDVVVQAKYSHSSELLELSFLRYREEGIAVYLFSPEGEMIVPDGTSISENRVSELIKRLSETETGEELVYRFGDTLNFAARCEYESDSAMLLVSYPLGIVRQTVNKMQMYLLIISLVVLAVAFIISYTMSQKLTRGIKNMSDTAVRFAKGDYSVQFANADFSELAQLSDTMNYVRDEVKKSRDFQREIIANVTHDLKTPLTMIKAYASMVQEISGDNPEKRNAHLQVIIDEADRLTGLVNDVLSVSKVNANLDNLNLKVFNLTDLLYGIIDKFGFLQENGYKLMVDIDSNIYTRADEEKIKQVIYNLLSNAVSYTGEDKTVYISLKGSYDGKRVKFTVRDTGKGISQEELPHIWERYYRSTGENHNRPIKGTGLGLNIVKVILENHSFDFGVDSVPGQGSAFWVDFPAVPSDPEMEE